MTTRRNFIKASILGAGAVTLSPSLQSLYAQAASPSLRAASSNKPPIRFIFMTKSNGLRPADLVPTSFNPEQRELDKQKQPMDADLTQQQLPVWMSGLESHKKDMAIIQGLSAKGMACGHNGHQACLGMFRVGNDRNLGSILWATADVELGRLYPSPFEHIELQTVAANRGIVAGRAATGKMQYNYAYADPMTAYNELFGSVATTADAKNIRDVQSLVLDYINQDAAGKAQGLHDIEQLKMVNYKKTVDQIKQRDQKLRSMSDRIAANMPELDKSFLAEDTSTVMRQQAYVQILLGALKAGLTNSALISLDTLKTPYTGLRQLEESDIVGLHDIGHGKGYGKHDSADVRSWVRIHHMDLMKELAENLKQTPEGDGTMFDNTVIMYQAENGETHHSHGTEQPIVMLAGKNTRMNFLGNYVRLPGYGQQGHKTLGNWYTTLLNNHGNPIPHYGQEDLNLKRLGIEDQKGPIKNFLV